MGASWSATPSSWQLGATLRGRHAETPPAAWALLHPSQHHQLGESGQDIRRREGARSNQGICVAPATRGHGVQHARLTRTESVALRLGRRARGGRQGRLRDRAQIQGRGDVSAFPDHDGHPLLHHSVASGGHRRGDGTGHRKHGPHECGGGVSRGHRPRSHCCLHHNGCAAERGDDAITRYYIVPRCVQDRPPKHYGGLRRLRGYLKQRGL